MARWNIGPKNGFWKGGRTISEHGYILVRVGMGHHLADVRGYAYEHRVVAEKTIGRKLRKGEVVHHKDENRINNAPENLEVCKTIAQHRFRHRDPESKKRKPGERNPLILCLCGCGRKFRKFDSSNRPRRFISGHNIRKRHGKTN